MTSNHQYVANRCTGEEELENLNVALWWMFFNLPKRGMDGKARESFDIHEVHVDENGERLFDGITPGFPFSVVPTPVGFFVVS